MGTDAWPTSAPNNFSHGPNNNGADRPHLEIRLAFSFHESKKLYSRFITIELCSSSLQESSAGCYDYRKAQSDTVVFNRMV